ncbi:hypothetical protein ACDA55_37900, partial [Rhizobium ruizarguesonis]
TDLAAEAYAKFDPRNLVAYYILAKARTPYTFSSDELFVIRTGPFLNQFGIVRKTDELRPAEKRQVVEAHPDRHDKRH